MATINKLVVKLQESFGTRVAGASRKMDRRRVDDKRRVGKSNSESNEPEVFSREIRF